MINLFTGKIVGIWKKLTQNRKKTSSLPFPLHNFTKDLAIFADTEANKGNLFIATRIRLALRLLEISYSGKYITDIEASYLFNYGEAKVIEEGGETDGAYSVMIKWVNAFDDEHNYEINTRFFEEMTNGHYRTERAKEIAWKIISVYIKVENHLSNLN